MLFEPYVRFHSFSLVRVTAWPPIWKKLLILLKICYVSIST